MQHKDDDDDDDCDDEDNEADADEDIIDTQNIEAEIDEAVLTAYKQVIAEMQEKGKLVKQSRDMFKRGAGGAGKRAAADEAEEEVPNVADSNSLTMKVAPSRENRLLTRRNSIINYKPSKTNVTPFLRKKGGVRTLKHSSTVDLVHNVERERKEEEFRNTMQQTILTVAEELKIDISMQQIYNCQGIIETMRRSKGIVVTGPQCTGKTQLVKIVTIALKRAFNVTLRSTFITPETFTNSEIFGPTQAFQHSVELAPEQNAIRKSVFDIILDNYAREKGDLRASEAGRLVQSIYVDSQQIDTDLGESVSTFLRDTNVREREYHKDTEFILSFTQDNKKIQSVQVQHTPMRFPNGNVIMMPSDLFFFFECVSLENMSPVFLANVGIVNTQHTDVTPRNLFFRQLQLVEKKHEAFIKEFSLDMEHFRACAEKFVMKFVLKLNEQPLIQNWSLWSMKSA